MNDAMIETFRIYDSAAGDGRDIHSTLKKAIIDFVKRYRDGKQPVFVFDNDQGIIDIGQLCNWLRFKYNPDWDVFEPIAKLHFDLTRAARITTLQDTNLGVKIA